MPYTIWNTECHVHTVPNSLFSTAKPPQVVSNEMVAATSRAAHNDHAPVVGLLGHLLGTSGMAHFTGKDHDLITLYRQFLAWCVTRATLRFLSLITVISTGAVESSSRDEARYVTPFR